MKEYNRVTSFEKITAILSYLTFGTVGVIYIAIGAMCKKSLKPFLRYHLFMSVFLGILLYVLSHVIILILNIAGFIPFLRAIAGTLTYFAAFTLFTIGNLSFNAVTIAIWGLNLYMCAGALLEKRSYLPWLTDIVEHNAGE